MSDISPQEFGRLTAKVETLEQQVAEMRADLKAARGMLGALVGLKFVPGLTWVERDHCRRSFEAERRGAHLPAACRNSP